MRNKDAIEYNLIRSSRKTIAIQVSPDGSVTVRAPNRCSRAAAEEYVQKNREWIRRTQAQLQNRAREQKDYRERLPEWTKEDYEKHQELARQVLQRRAEYYARQMQVSYGRVAVKDQKTRWGSCSAKGNLNFNWRLILAPGEVLDYVVVHELAHRREMNHSVRFWNLVESVLPDYQQRKRWLKENGDRLMGR